MFRCVDINEAQEVKKHVLGGKWLVDALYITSPVILGGMLIGMYYCLTKPKEKIAMP